MAATHLTNFITNSCTGPPDEKIGFSAHLQLDGATVTTFTKNSIVAYDQVLVNLGEGYNPSSGAFTVSVPGIYSFTLYFMTSQSKGSGLGIYVNNERQCTNYAYQPYGASSCSILKELKKGDVVNVKAFHGNGASLYTGLNTYKNQNGFVGFLYKPT